MTHRQQLDRKRDLYNGQNTASVQNNSATTFVDGDIQSGVVNAVAHNTAYGALFHGSTAVVFPTPFASLPQVFCNAGGAAGVAGGFAAYATNITVNGFTLNVVAVAAGSTDSNRWTAIGVI